MIKLGAHEDWTKSSYSGPNGACVEIKSTAPDAVRVSDSKIVTDRPEFSVSPSAFVTFVEYVK